MKPLLKPFGVGFIVLMGLGCPLAKSLSLQEAQTLAIQNSLQIQLVKQKKKVILKQLQTIGLSIPPDIKVEGGLGFSGEKNGLMELSLELEKQRQNRLLNQAEKALGNLDLKNLLLDEQILETRTRLDILQAYADAWISHLHHEELKDQIQHLENLVKVLAIQKENGQTAGLDLNLARSELAKDQLEIHKAENLKQSKWLALQLLISQGDKPPKQSPLQLKITIPEIGKLSSGIERRSGELVEIQKEIRRLEIEAQKIRAEGKRQISKSFSLGFEKPRDKELEGIFSFGITRTRENRGKIHLSLEENQLLIEEAKQKLSIHKKLLLLELGRSLELAMAATEPVRILEKDILPEFKKNLETLRKTYQLGHIGLQELLGQERQLMALTLDLQDSRQEAMQAWLDVFHTAQMGVLP